MGSFVFTDLASLWGKFLAFDYHFQMKEHSYPEDPLNPETVQLQCRIPATWGRALKERAQSRGSSISKEFRLALNRYIAEEKISL